MGVSLFEPHENAIPIIFPDCKNWGRVWIPFQFVTESEGVARYLRSHPHAPSLCMLFQTGRCFSGKNCNQIHVEKGYVSHVKSTLSKTQLNNCCLTHGDIASASEQLGARVDRLEMRIAGESHEIGADQIAVTSFWNPFLQQGRRVLYFSSDRVCQLHQQNLCKYGLECKNVHLCRFTWAQYSNSAPAMEPVQVVSTQSHFVEKKRLSRALDIVDPKDCVEEDEQKLAVADLTGSLMCHSPPSLENSPEVPPFPLKAFDEAGSNAEILQKGVENGLRLWQRTPSPTYSPPSDKDWQEKTESFKRTIKSLPRGLLGVLQPLNPTVDCPGFSIGRGRPLLFSIKNL